jgi:hypothetical protein
MNDNGTRLLDINNLTIRNEVFKHKQIHKYTWTQSKFENNNNIIIRESNNIKINDVRVFKEAGSHSDYYLLK